jgi:CelD/BcsL family acetyltransferase involved in cellulose biosynthesis
MQPDLAGRVDFARQPEIGTVNPLDEPDWDRLVLSHSGFNFFHRTAWAKVLCRTYGHKPYYFHFYRGKESLGLLPVMEVVSPFTGRRGVSMPFSDFCEPLVLSRWAQKELLFGTLLKLGRERKWSYFEVRGASAGLPATATAAERYYGHKLNLTLGVERLSASFQGSVRRAIRKAQKSGLTAEVTKSAKAMTDFYRLHVQTRRRHGLPPQPFRFFRNIHEEVVKAGLGFVVLAKYRLQLVAGAFFFHSGDEALFKFGASDAKFQQVRGNNLVIWEGIKQLVGQGLKTLHFGRTEVNDDGLRRFKLSWGTEEGVIEYFRFALNAQKWLNSGRNAFEFHHRLFRNLPLAANQVAGALIYPHLD